MTGSDQVEFPSGILGIGDKFVGFVRNVVDRRVQNSDSDLKFRLFSCEGGGWGGEQPMMRFTMALQNTCRFTMNFLCFPFVLFSDLFFILSVPITKKDAVYYIVLMPQSTK